MKRILAFLMALVFVFSVCPTNIMAADEEGSSAQNTRAVTVDEKLWTDYAADSFDGGSGTEADPYRIKTAAQLAYLAKRVNSGTAFSGVYFELVSNISILQHLWVPIAYKTFRFSGYLNGNGYLIEGMRLKDASILGTCCGLFGNMYGSVSNLKMTSIEVLFSKDMSIEYYGSIAGYSAGTICNVDVSGAISVRSSTKLDCGGVVGCNIATLEGCSFSGTVQGSSLAGAVYIGGIVGDASTISKMKNNYSTGNVYGTASAGTCNAGGHSGYQTSALTNCYSKMNVTARGIMARAGGLVGALRGELSYSYATGNVVATSYKTDGWIEPREAAGGLVGSWWEGNIKYCYAANASVSSNLAENHGAVDTNAGKLVGFKADTNSSSVVSSYVSGSVSLNRIHVTGTEGCDGNITYSYEEIHEANCTVETGTFTYSESFIKNTLKWGMYSNLASVSNGVWIYQSGSPILYTQSICSLTVRYINDDGEIFDVWFNYFDKNSQYSVTSPDLYGTLPDKAVVSGTITQDTYVDVTYSHEHIPGEAPTCTSPQTCTLCGAVVAEKLPHKYDLVEVVPPSCTGNGYTRHSCSDCDTYYDDTITSPHGHKLDENNVCTVCGESFEAPLNDYVIYIYDTETGGTIEGAEVTLGSDTLITDTVGAAKFQLKSFDSVTLKITAETYPDHTVASYLPSDLGVDHIYLTSDESDIYGVWCNGDNVLNGESQINAKAHFLTAKIVVNGRAKANIVKYELVQDSIVIATSDNGVFEVMNPHFKMKKDVYVRMRTDGTDGHNLFERKVNINVVGYSLNFETDLKPLLPFSTGFKMIFPDGTPGFAGFELKFPNPFLKTTDVTYRHENDKIMVLFGFDHDYAEDPSLDDLTNEELFEKILDDWASDKKKNKSKEVHGSLALVLEFNENGVSKVYGQINVGFNLEFSAGKTFMVGIIPIYGEIEMGFGGEFEVSNIGYDTQNAKLLIPEYDVVFDGKITLYAGVGIPAASVGVYGQLGLQLVLSSEQKNAFEKFSLHGEMGLYAKLKFLFFKELSYKYPIFYGQKTWPERAKTFSASMISSPMLYSVNNYTDDTRAYLNGRSEWLNLSMLSDEGSAYSLLQDSVYNGIEPELVACGDTVMMLFLDDDGSEGLNYQHLYYSLYEKGTGSWSTPVRVDSNNYSDIEFDVYTDGSKIYVAYTELGSITEENADDYEKILSTAEVVFAEYDPIINSFSGNVKVSENSSFDTMPRIAETEEGLSVVWVNNITNDVFSQNANNVITLSNYSNGEWSGASPLTERGATVISMDIGVLNGKSCIAVVRDIDCDLSSADDRILELIELNGVSSKIVTEKNTNDGVVFVEMDGESQLIWFNDGNIYKIGDSEDEPTALFNSKPDGLSAKYRFLQTGNGEYAILFVKNEQVDDGNGNMLNGSNIYGLFCTNGSWGNAIKVTQNGNGYYIDAFDACMSDGKMVIPYVNSEASFTENDIEKTSVFVCATPELKNDLAIGNVEFVPGGLFKNGSIEISVPIYNNSPQKVSNIYYEVRRGDGESILSGTMIPDEKDQIESGDNGYITFALPKDMLVVGDEYRVYVNTEEWIDTDAGNNIADLKLWYTDFSVDGAQVRLSDENKLQYSVTNKGNIAGNALLKVYRENTDGTVVELNELTITGLESGKSVSGSFDINDSYFSDGAVSENIFLSVIPENDELYDYNDLISLCIGTIEKNSTNEITDSAALESPVLKEHFVTYDLESGESISVEIDEKGFTFTGIGELEAQNYSYSSGVLILGNEYLQTLTKGYYYYTLTYTNTEKSTDVMLIVGVTDSGYTEVSVTAEDQTAKYDGYPLEITQDIKYETVSLGVVSAEYSQDGGVEWHSGLPTEIGEYTVRLKVANDDVNKYLNTSCTFTLTVEKGTRAISIPNSIFWGREYIGFDSAIPTAGIGDGIIEYGYSSTNDHSGVTEWSSVGYLSNSDIGSGKYLFARITGGENYEDAYSIGYLVTAHVHSYVITRTAPTCTSWEIITYTCSCGDTYSERGRIPLGHKFGDWVIDTHPTPESTGARSRTCSVCRGGQWEQLPAVEKPAFKGASLLLHDNLTINYKVDKTAFDQAGYTNPYAVFEFRGTTITVDTYTVVDDRYVFKFENISPHFMGETVISTLYGEFDGKVYAGKSIEYGVSVYAYKMLDKYSGEDYSELRTLLVDMLTYGAKSQLYMNYATDALCDSALTVTQLSWGTKTNPELNTVFDVAYEKIDNPTVEWKAAGLNLNNSISLRFKLSADSIEGLTVKVQCNSQSWIIPSERFEETSGGYYLYFDQLNATQMKDSLYLTVYKNGVAVSDTLCYSVESYAYKKQNSEIPYLSDLVNTMINYGNSAYNYVNN